MALETISTKERADAALFAVEMAKSCIRTDTGFVHPNTMVGRLSDWAWQQIAMGAVSGWVAERSRQVGAENVLDEHLLLAVGHKPEPRDLGLARLTLPHLGDLVVGMGVTDKAITDWSEEEVATFVWTAAELLAEIRSRASLPFDMDGLLAAE
jgi:hypothetical protein